MEREKFGSRFGFIMISAGCAIGLGNVYRFPILTGGYGGALFVLIYIVFLVLIGVPVMTAELSVGRASQRSIATSFDMMEKEGQKWHLMKILGIGGNYLLMMSYTCIAGLMCIYFVKYLTGPIANVKGSDALLQVFNDTVGNPWIMLLAAAATIVICFLICMGGVKNGLERVNKIMMVALFGLLTGLVIYSLTLDKAAEGIRFYLVPDVGNIGKAGLGNVITAAMGQAFFTLSIGMGAISIFGSYIGKERRLAAEARTIVILDTVVAIMSGLIIFPACFTFNNGVTADPSTVGSSFLFTTLSNVFNHMQHGRIVGAVFFLLLVFAAFSTVSAVFENIISFWLELTKLSRKTICLINIALVLALSLPAVFSFNIWSAVNFQAIEDRIVSNFILPAGAIFYVLFCTHKFGWGWQNFIKETNTGRYGSPLSEKLRPYMAFVLPCIIALVMILSLL